MLRNLYVKNLALIDEIDIDFDEGLTALTGETGAGKSIILGAINTALGMKVNPDSVRDASKEAVAQLSFYFDDPRFLLHLPEIDIDENEAEEIIIRRTISNGRSRFKLNGRDVTSGQIRALAPFLLDLHAQRDSLLLLKEKEQLALTDHVFESRISELTTQLAELLKEKNEYEAKLLALGEDEESRRREADLLRFEYDELSEAALVSGEDISLDEKFKKYENADLIKKNTLAAISALSDDDTSSGALLAFAIKSLEEIKDICGDELRNVIDTLYDADSIISDSVRELSSFSDNTEADEEEFSFITQRLNTYNRLKDKYHCDTDELIALCDSKEERLKELENSEALISEYQERTNALTADIKRICSELTQIRREAAVILSKQIAEAAAELNFNDVRFEIEITETDSFTNSGNNKAEFMISVNPGEALRPLREVSSGGELSRIMLAIKTVAADRDNTETLLFDEIDTGISGRTAQMTAQRMAVLAGKRQIICITHLPQIAAMADNHYLIEKEVKSDRSVTAIRKLDSADRTVELSRLLGGTKITENVKKNAEEMITFAKEYKMNHRV